MYSSHIYAINRILTQHLCLARNSEQSSFCTIFGKMYFSQVTLLLLLYIYVADGVGINGLGNVYRYFLKEMNSTGLLMESDTTSIKSNWIDLPLDHFNIKEKRTWKMRYFERLDMWKPGKPIYLFMNGEGPASSAFLKTGIMYDLAKETNGAMFLSEHRYYGKSMPLNNSNTENMKYLSSRQALADNAQLLACIKSIPKFNDSKVVVIGGSYAGNLAAWMKLLYPDVVDAALASSAPVLAKLDFYEYLETVSEDLDEYGPPGCLDKVSKIFKRYEDLFSTDEGIEVLKKEENICADNDMRKEENRQLFFLEKASNFMYLAQYGNPDKIYSYCEDQKSLLPNDRDEFNPVWNKKNNCFDYDFDNMIESIREIDWYLSWTYQTCTEFSYFQTTNSDSQPFTRNVPIELYYKMCTKLFGPEFNEDMVKRGVNETNRLYGGLNLNVTKVVFVNGQMDPWSKLSILEDLSYEAPAAIVPRSSHCRDLFSDRSSDPEELKEVRRYVKYLIKRWIGAGEYRTL
ncbi:putative serine protease K12H4.7 [Galleria mellonella]|uniref:Serine protease K12H4.7 n=1 Tax=Galleria mellonella TaxID=7137 RepID=A0A6J1X104_GALME|nr:putative serine protease K12H4.7 [Galleria mellonella]